MHLKTNYTPKLDFRKYIDGTWQDSNQLYAEYMSWENNKFFVQEIKNFDVPLLREIKNIWNMLGIRPYDWRCNFFKVLPGGEIPLHVDVKSQCSVVIPVTENTGALYFEDGTEVLYDSMTVINTKVKHGVKSPTKERIVFHMGIHDIPFEEIKIGHYS
jgi:hypothetical protein